jgi:hypothetical protein
MSSAVATPVRTMGALQLTSPSDVSYTAFKQAMLVLHEQGKDGAKEGDFQVLTRGIQMLNDMASLFPGYARQLADDPEFLR